MVRPSGPRRRGGGGAAEGGCDGPILPMAPGAPDLGRGSRRRGMAAVPDAMATGDHLAGRTLEAHISSTDSIRPKGRLILIAASVPQPKQRAKRGLHSGRSGAFRPADGSSRPETSEWRRRTSAKMDCILSAVELLPTEIETSKFQKTDRAFMKSAFPVRVATNAGFLIFHINDLSHYRATETGSPCFRHGNNIF